MKDSYSPNEIVVIDVEASGLDLDVSYPIEVAWLSLSGESDEFLVNPESTTGWDHWDQFAEDSIHHISRNECVKNGLTVEQAAKRLSSQLCGCLVVSDGMSHDKTWLTKLFHKAGEQVNFDTISIHDFVTSLGHHPDLITQYYREKRNLDVKHRAMSDCEMSLRIIKEIGIIN
ncbi:exonuclease domain-containing protein [Vibrio splendidus]|nr:3'-5' exonuclease [Vibrio splendidus]MCC4880732.1 3'-5' exonuclease [Vibrio splendidus]